MVYIIADFNHLFSSEMSNHILVIESFWDVIIYLSVIAMGYVSRLMPST